jgi:hypothetical protein
MRTLAEVHKRRCPAMHTMVCHVRLNCALQWQNYFIGRLFFFPTLNHPSPSTKNGPQEPTRCVAQTPYPNRLKSTDTQGLLVVVATLRCPPNAHDT